jgi:Phage protein D
MKDVNNPIVTPNARHVTGRCFLAGVEVPFVSFDVDSNAFASADTFSVTFAASALPKSFGLLNWWATQTGILIELHAVIISQAGVDDKKLIVGNVDTWHYDPARFEIVCEGRDFTALFIDTKTAGESFKNQTSSQIAEDLAKRHSLTPVVTATTTKFGEFYQIDSAHLSGEQTEWDILTSLAAIENYQVYVTGYELHFEPLASIRTADNYVIRWQPPGTLKYPQANVSDDLQFSRAMTIMKGVTVEVLSWSSKKKNKQFIAAYPKNAKSTAVGGSTPRTQAFRIIRDGLTPETAMQLAQSTYNQIVKHAMKISGSMPGDNLLMPTDMIRVEGTQSPFDQLYYCDSVKRTISFEGGYAMSFTGKNQSPNLEASG